MTTFVYSATASADGYIAAGGGDMSWLTPFMDDAVDPILEALIPTITVLLTGRTTYDGDDPNAGDPEHEGAFSGAWEGPQVVLTHRELGTHPADVHAARTFEKAVQQCRDAAGAEGVVNVLGADVARQCLEAKVLAEVIISTVPVLLGGGTPLLSGASRSFNLDPVESVATAIGRTTRYRVKP